MLFFTAAILLCAERDAQCKTRESPSSIFNFLGFAQAQLRKKGQITSLSTSQSAVFALCRGRRNGYSSCYTAGHFVHHGLSWMGRKAVEMRRYCRSEALRNPTLQKKATDYALDKLNPMIQNVGSQAVDQLSTKIRPKKNYKTNRKDLDGDALDIHKAIGKLPKPQAGWTLPGHRYTGPYNDLEKQVRYNPETGERIEIYDPPTGPTDAIAMQHDVDYSYMEIIGSAKIKQIEKW